MKKIKLSDGKIIEMREPKVKDMKIAQSNNKSDQEQEITLISNLTGIAPDEIDEFTLKDYGKLQEGLKDFLP